MQASPAKLPDDTWGVRVFDPGSAGDWAGQPVTVSAKSGKTWQSQLTDLVSHDPAKGVALYRKADKKAPAQQPLPPLGGGAVDNTGELTAPPTQTAAQQFYVDVTYVDSAQVDGTFGPFQARANAEQALITVAARTDVSSARLRTDA